jgi:hypothetical protein
MELKNVQIVHIGELKQVTPTYKKVEFVVKIESQYPQEVVFETSGEKADKFLQYNKVGNFVDIDFNLRGRSYLKDGGPESSIRWFNSLDAWKIFKSETQTDSAVEAYEAKQTPQQEEEADDLPF